jgi:hypothetical protein
MAMASFNISEKSLLTEDSGLMAQEMDLAFTPKMATCMMENTRVIKNQERDIALVAVMAL